ncbi:predicted protein [Aspergillus terreus NIH2624]|uniref:Uncharacterized protein n=1 Tax=Aspergillus terreus (strain NIH 2624 / FGSC A1156) TaxID=341663 RepID=Q0CAU0_ASPTN|nr:uncharacterized protein ATEG_09194 [Aspergillus terreus NIH2624]EAU30331.1 predicted protein [Aspergillus terreus NIH2624]
MSSNTKTFYADLYGEHEGRHPSMGDLKNRLAVDVKKKMVDVIADRPGTAYVDYQGETRRVADHGKLYDDASGEELTFGPDGSNTNPGHWKGWTTAHLRTTFHFDDI